MTNPVTALSNVFVPAIVRSCGLSAEEVDPIIRPVNPQQTDADFQVNAAMSLAKKVGRSPREVAQGIVDELDTGVEGPIGRVEIAGPGFINVWLQSAWIQSACEQLGSDTHLGVPQTPGQRIVIDYSSPNAAKEMHVGHIRTTVVGDALARTFEAIGARVHRMNHLGDWGTPFGMLIEHLRDVGEDSEQADQLNHSPNVFYQAARAKFDGDEAFAARARARVTLLQSEDPETLTQWRSILDRTVAYLERAYRDLDVTLKPEHIAGESFYRDQLAQICEELIKRGIAQVDDGALCVFSERFTGKDDSPLPIIIRKSDGGYGYATTDLATIRYRAQELNAHRALYVVGAEQHLHFKMVWDAAERAGWLGECVPEHVQIGPVLGPDGKMLRTRSGESVKLQGLLDEALEKARAVVDEAARDLDDAQREAVSHDVALGALKYADLSVSHDSGYTFDVDRMVAFTGNTGPYLQYASTRIASLSARAADAGVEPGAIALREPAERALGLALLDFGPTVAQVAELSEPHRLAGYLFSLAQTFTTFYEQCPVLKADSSEITAERLALAQLTRQVLVRGLSLLGIPTPERM